MSTATATRRPARIVGADGTPLQTDGTADRKAAPPKSGGSAKREPVKPIDEVRIGRVKAAIWQNVVQTDRGESFTRYGVTFERLYRTRDGQWRGTGSFDKDDLLLLAKVAEAAFARINEILAERPI